jgi:hypothetical protein
MSEELIDTLASTFDLVLDGMLADYGMTMPDNLNWQAMTAAIASRLAENAMQDIDEAGWGPRPTAS